MMELAPTSEQLKIWLRINRLQQGFKLSRADEAMLEFLRHKKSFTYTNIWWLERIEEKHEVFNFD